MGPARLLALGSTIVLLAASGTAAAAQTLTEDEVLLPGVSLATEQVEPGVVKVTSDGVRDLSWSLRPVLHRDDYEEIDAAAAEAASGDVVAGYDGSIWLVWKDGLFRLGGPDTRRVGARWRGIGASSDGRLWGLGLNGPMAFDGVGWEHPSIKLPRGFRLFDVQMQPDGTLWALLMREDGKLLRVARAGGDRWVPLDWKYRKAWSGAVWPDVRLDVAEDAAWLFVQGEMVRGKTSDMLVRLRGDTVREVEIPNHVEAMAAGLDGTVWLDLYRSDGPTLARRDGQDWTRFKRDDGVDAIDPGFGLSLDRFDVGPDGSLWARPRLDDAETAQPCRGLVNFDGERWRQYLADRCIYAMDIAPDGRVWALAGTRESWLGVWTEEVTLPAGDSPTSPVELYVIDPSAATA